MTRLVDFVECGPIPQLGNVLLGNGSARFIKETIGIRTFAKLVTRKGREVLSADQF